MSAIERQYAKLLKKCESRWKDGFEAGLRMGQRSARREAMKPKPRSDELADLTKRIIEWADHAHSEAWNEVKRQILAARPAAPLLESSKPMEPHRFIGDPKGRCDACGASNDNDIHCAQGGSR